MARSAIVPQVPFTYPALAEAPLVLCVDDEPAILELLEDVLTACGLRPLCTDDCNLALTLCEEPIDLVVLDYHMPQMDGLTLATKIRERNPNLPMIFFSGAPLPVESLAHASRVVHKSEGAMRLATTILQSIRARV
ncbi:response regulator receiver protein [Candidatus Koribacter versatilis Ellin345]|uniref:Response regulator receiver protein n=1 Tax=Koribacter versatilis (strain Ellin345) TaxID=204669 RepID=Q1IT58_KORVE|nr:response regulator [Candidatus Koribacter versatilis]ABF39942.1 response regulator receiver protein [Candidatus Koribacter versatilis Ellin345]